MKAKSIKKVQQTSSIPAAPLSTLADFSQAAYSELRSIAGKYFQTERKDHTLQPTALVHEMYLRLAIGGPETYVNRAHFFGCASRAMRQILVEAARKHRSGKRGGRDIKIPLQGLDLATPEIPDYIAIDSALEQLTADDPCSAQIAELRIFAGLSVKEAAFVLDLAPSTVRNRWAAARASLEKHIRNA